MSDQISSKNLWKNLFEKKVVVELSDYLNVYQKRITQDSEKLFVSEFLYPILGKKNIKYVIPQYLLLIQKVRIEELIL